MKVLFQEIRRGDLASVRTRIDARPELVAVTAKAPPKKDDGQSPLQVAIKTGRFEIAHLLLDRGADVHFMETSALNRWNTPVLHDAVRAAVFSSRFGRTRPSVDPPPEYELVTTEEDFRRALGVLVRLLAAGADPNRLDSAGNPALLRAILDARQVLVSPISPELLRHDLQQVFDALQDAGADPRWVDPRFGRSLVGEVAGTPIAHLLR